MQLGVYCAHNGKNKKPSLSAENLKLPPRAKREMRRKNINAARA
jgi:hypothetical protein